MVWDRWGLGEKRRNGFGFCLIGGCVYQVGPGLFVGDIEDGRAWEGALVNLSRVRHCELVGSSHLADTPFYVFARWGDTLSFNTVDGPARYFEYVGAAGFEVALDFIAEYDAVLVSCDAGVSRSPTVAMAYLAKRLHTIPNQDFESAYESFIEICPWYRPGGIADFVSDHWEEIT